VLDIKRVSIAVKLVLGLVGLSLLNACASSDERKQANRGFDYTQEA